MVAFTLVVAGAEVLCSICRFSTRGPADEILATNNATKNATNSPVTGRNRGSMVEALRSPSLLLVPSHDKHSRHDCVTPTPSPLDNLARLLVRKGGLEPPWVAPPD